MKRRASGLELKIKEGREVGGPERPDVKARCSNDRLIEHGFASPPNYYSTANTPVSSVE